MMKKTFHKAPLQHRQAGNIFFMLFGAVAIVGAIGASTMSNLKGIATSMSEVTRKEVAEQKMTGAARLAIQAATAVQTNAGDCDSDGWVEPLPFKPAGGAPAPVGGGLIPDGIGAEQRDPWGTLYGYCVWDGGVSTGAPGCGGPGANRLAGSPSGTGHPIVAIISAGKDRRFTTSCNGYVDTTPADGNPDTPLIGRAASGDDIIMEYTYNDASGVSGDDLWKIRDADPTTAMIDKNIEVTGGGQFGGALNLMSAGLVLPADPGDNSVTGPCNALTDQQIRINIGTSPPSFEICHGNTWAAVEMGSNDGGYNRPTEVTEIVSDDIAAGDRFAQGLASDGNTFVLTAPFAKNGGITTGSAYVFAKSGGVWIQSQKLIASDGVYADYFSSPAISGNTIAIGTRNVNGSQGAVYIFTKTNGVWIETQKLVASDAAANDVFGWNVKLSGNTLVVAAPQDDDMGADSGSLYIFTKTNGTWAQTQKLTAADGIAGDSLGWGLGIDQNTIVAGAHRRAENGAFSGAVYIFTKNGSTWAQTQKILPSDPQAGARFGIGVSISGNTIYVGGTDSDNGLDGGYIFTKTNGVWAQTQKLTVPKQSGGSELYGDTLIAGATNDDTNGSNAGSVYVFKNLNGTWTQTDHLFSSDISANDEFGSGIALTKNTAIIGAKLHDHNGSDSGAAYVFEGMKAKKSYASTTPPTGWYIKGLMKNSNFLGCRSAGRGPFAVAGQSDAIANSTVLAIGNNMYSAGGNSFSAFNRNNGGIGRDRTQTAASDMNSVWVSGMFGSMLTSSSTSNILRAWTYTPGSLNNIATYTGPANLGAVWNDKSYVYTAGAAGVVAYSYSGSSFTPLATFNEIGTGNTIWGDGKFLYVTDTSGMLYVLAFNGASFSLIDSISFGGVPTDAYGDGRYIYVATNSGLFVFGFDAQELSYLYQATGITNLTAIWGDGANIYVGNNLGEIKALTFTGTSIKTYSNYKVGANPITDIQGDGNNIYVAQGSAPVVSLSGFSCGQSIAPNPAVVLATNKYRDKISSGFTHSCGIKEDNTAWCWGDDSNGQLGNGSSVTTTQTHPYLVSSATTQNNYVTISTGTNNSTCALKADGTAWCWGRNANGQLGNGTFVDQDAPVQVIGGHLWSQISSGLLHTCGIRIDGTAWCWGMSNNGRLGIAPAGNQHTPVQVLDIGPWVFISAGNEQTCGIKTDGSAWCWGQGDQGRMGNGSTNSSNVPVPVAEPGPWVHIGDMADTTCATKLDGTAWCWGRGTNGKFGDGNSTEYSTIPVKIPDPGPWLEVGLHTRGSAGVCGIKIDGTAWCWGQQGGTGPGRFGINSSSNQIFPISIINDPGPWASVRMGLNHSCGIKIDGSAWCWGSDASGQLGNGASLSVNQLVPSRVYNFSNAAPWQWNDTQTSTAKAVSTAPVIIPSSSAIGYDANNGGLSFSGTGTTVLRRTNGDVEFAIDTTATNSSAQLSFDAQALANAASIGIDYQNGNLEFFRNSGTASNWAHSVNPAIFITPQGNIGIGNSTAANARLDLSPAGQGGLKIGDDTRECTPSRQGTLKYVAGAFQFCNGTAWTAL